MKEEKLIAKLKRDKKTVQQIRQEMGWSEHRARKELQELRKQHFNVRAERNRGQRTVYWIDDSRASYRTHFISGPQQKRLVELYGTPSDIHIGSKLHDEQAFLEYMKRAFEEHGVKRFFICGDLVDGRDIYHGHLNFLKAVTQQDQVDMVCEELPDWKGVEYVLIDGNHDYSWTQKGAPFTGELIAQKRNDVTYLGPSVGDVILDGVRIRLLHGAGGGAYSVTYPIQRYMRNISMSGEPREKIPKVLHVGHYHKRLDGVEVESGAIATMCGNFQEPNEWYMRRGYVGPRGAHIVYLGIEDGKLMDFDAKWLNTGRETRL
jgi:predicted phosphodiesterase/biotin operon repressor